MQMTVQFGETCLRDQFESHVCVKTNLIQQNVWLDMTSSHVAATEANEEYD